MTTNVTVTFSMSETQVDAFHKWLQQASSVEGCPVVGYRADDFVARRAALSAFVDQMEQVLRRHDQKSTWRDRPVEALKKLLELELKEFEVAFEYFEVKEARHELIDVANFCLILWDRLSLLNQDKPLNTPAHKS